MGDLTFSLMTSAEPVPEPDSMLDIDADDIKGGNKTAAEAAQKSYNKAVLKFYKEVLPRGDGQKYYETVKAKAVTLHNAWQAYSKAGGDKLEYMDAFSFNVFYEKQYAKAHPPQPEKNNSTNTTNGTNSSNNSNSTSNNSTVELMLSLMSEPVELAAKPTAWAELEALRTAGIAFEESIQDSVANMVADGDVYSRANKFYPYTDENP